MGPPLKRDGPVTVQAYDGGVVAGALAGGDDSGGAAITGGGVVAMGAELAGAVVVAGGAVTGAGALDEVVGADGDAAIEALPPRDAWLTVARLAEATG